MVDEGTGNLSAIEVSDALARIGGDYDVDTGSDAFSFALTTLVRFADRGADLLAGLLTRPSLRESDFTRVRQLRLDRLRQMKDVAPALAERAFLRLLYGRHPYGHTALGSEEGLRAIIARRRGRLPRRVVPPGAIGAGGGRRLAARGIAGGGRARVRRLDRRGRRSPRRPSRRRR